ncbi:MAG: hypothetical protein AB2A00_36900 [Myxococcota bacterium]
MRAAAVVISLMLTLPAADATLVTVEARSEKGLLTLAVPTPGTLTPKLAGKLKDGLKHIVRYSLSLRPENDPTVLLHEELTTEVLWELWDEAFFISHSEAGLLRRSRVRTADKVRGILERPQFHTAFPVTGLEPARRYVVDVTVEVDPVSEEVKERVRKMLVPPPGDADTSPGRSFLGNVIQLFIKDDSSSSSGSAALTFRSQPFLRPGGGAP